MDINTAAPQALKTFTARDLADIGKAIQEQALTGDQTTLEKMALQLSKIAKDYAGQVEKK